jgi:membrane fusion protein (multidrug efflux system)
MAFSLAEIRGRPLLPAALILILGISLSSCKKKAVVLPPPTVEVAAVEVADVPIYQEWIGTLQGSVNADIRAQVQGYLLKQDYKEGRPIKKGELLFEIDPRPFQATLDEANGQLAEAQADQVRTQQNVDRYKTLVASGAISQEEYDNTVQANLSAQAKVTSAKAQVQKAALQLEFTELRSPIDGVAGLAQAQIGDLVGPTTPALTTVAQLDPIKVVFTVSEQEYLRFFGRQTDQASRQAYLKALQLALIFSNGQVYPHEGHLFAAQLQVDQQTGTLQLVGEFDNPENILRPGQFVRVKARTNFYKDAMLVPQRAVTQLQSLYQVAVVNESNTVEVRPVQVGERYGSQWVILDGLKPGERVVVEGVQKATQGAQVNVEPYTGPATAPASQPVENAQPATRTAEQK